MSEGEASRGCLSAYLNEIAKYPLLTADEERRLAQQMSAGRRAAERLATLDSRNAPACAGLRRRVRLGKQSRERLVVSSLRLVVSIAWHYRGSGISLLDVIQEGNIGLQAGVDRYDFTRGFRLSTFVVWWIRLAILDALEKNSHAVHLSTRAVHLERSARLVEQDMEHKFGRTPSADEVASRLGVSLDRLVVTRQAARSPISLDEPLRDGSGMTLGDMLVDEEATNRIDADEEQSERADLLAGTIERLPVRERQVLKLHFGLGQPERCSLAQIANRLGVTQERARQLEYRALRRIRTDSHAREVLAGFAPE
jgi:RNA polymerase sigma factor (sigma-70 family)